MVVVVVKAASWLWGRGLDFFSFHGFGHFYFSLGHPSSLTFKSGACSWVVGFCFGKEGDCCSQGCWLAVFGERKGHSLYSAAFIPPKYGGGVWKAGYPYSYPYLVHPRVGHILHSSHLE